MTQETSRDGRLSSLQATTWQGVCAMACVLAGTVAHGQQHWGYAGETGPLRWAALSPAYRACAGSNQSPVDLARFAEADLPPIQFDYAASGVEVVNNGHTVQVASAAGSQITVDGRVYRLRQFHFHAPSEHRINGDSFPMEAHLVHTAAEGALAVVAVLFRAGDANAALAETLKNVPSSANEAHVFRPPLAPAGLLPANRDYYRLNGSLTTPPCTEGVLWLVLKQPALASPAQIEALAKMLPGPNNRPLQPLNARIVLR